MPGLEYIRKLEEMETDVEIVESAEGDGFAILLSEPATRELCLALDEYLDRISPRDPDKQESVAFLYEMVMERFAFGRGSYVLTTGTIASVAGELFNIHTPEDADVWEKVRDAFDEVLE